MKGGRLIEAGNKAWKGDLVSAREKSCVPSKGIRITYYRSWKVNKGFSAVETVMISLDWEDHSAAMWGQMKSGRNWWKEHQWEAELNERNKKKAETWTVSKDEGWKVIWTAKMTIFNDWLKGEQGEEEKIENEIFERNLRKSERWGSNLKKGENQIVFSFFKDKWALNM